MQSEKRLSFNTAQDRNSIKVDDRSFKLESNVFPVVQVHQEFPLRCSQILTEAIVQTRSTNLITLIVTSLMFFSTHLRQVVCQLVHEERSSHRSLEVLLVAGTAGLHEAIKPDQPTGTVGSYDAVVLQTSYLIAAV